MDECIPRKAAIDSLLGWAAQLTETYGKNDEYVKCLERAANNIEQIPAADVRPVVRGRWEVDGHHIRCTNCGEYMCIKDREGIEIPREFCPNCGADMREES